MIIVVVIIIIIAVVSVGLLDAGVVYERDLIEEGVRIAVGVVVGSRPFGLNRS